MVAKEFFELIHRRLNRDGVYMMNLIGAVRGTNSRFFSAVSATLLQVFPELYVFAVDPGVPEATQNLILVAPAQELSLSRDELIERAGDNEQLLRMVRSLIPRRDYDLSGAPILTDNFNPVQYIIARQLRESE